jgi:hypothetical protein
LKVPAAVVTARRVVQLPPEARRKETNTSAPATAGVTLPEKLTRRARRTRLRFAATVIVLAAPRSPPEVVNRSWLPSAIASADWVAGATRPALRSWLADTRWGRQLRPPSEVRST